MRSKNNMPTKMGKRIYETFNTAVAAKEREGYSYGATERIIESILTIRLLDDLSS